VSEEIRNWFEFASWIAASCGLALAVVQLLREMRRSREQRDAELLDRKVDRETREADLKWRRAEAAKRLLDEMVRSQDAMDAITMLDWPGSTFEIPDEAGNLHRCKITRADYRTALNVPKARFSRQDHFICANFDGLLWYFAWIEHHIGTGLAAFEDVRFPADYYIDIMARDADIFSKYMNHYGLDRAASFMRRFPAWAIAIGSTRPPQLGFDDAFRGTTLGNHAGVPTDGRAVAIDTVLEA
jgi:hypothetical protein